MTNSPAYSPGLEGVIAGEIGACASWMKEKAVSSIAGMRSAIWRSKATFEEVAYLFLFGHLPTQSELKGFSAQYAAILHAPSPVEAFLGAVPTGAHPMDILRTSVSLLGMADPDAGRQFARRQRS